MIFIVTPEDLIISKLDWARDTRSEGLFLRFYGADHPTEREGWFTFRNGDGIGGGGAT